MEELEQALKPFLNGKGQLLALPAKRQKRQKAWQYLAEKLETGRRYTERELSVLLNRWTTFGDPATLRRELYDACLLDRTRDGAQYWRAEAKEIQ